MLYVYFMTKYYDCSQQNFMAVWTRVLEKYENFMAVWTRVLEKYEKKPKTFLSLS